jgi:hypothetical protein
MDLQPNTQPAAVLPLGLESVAVDDDFDFALGCECADPRLQIERWTQEARGDAA